jgi:hypothetical protein
MRYAKNKKLLVIILAFLLIAGGFVIYQNFTAEDPATEKISYKPATQEEKKQAADNKSRLVARDEAIQEAQNKQALNSANGVLNKVEPLLTDAAQYDNNVEVASYVPDAFEDGGTCTLKLSRGSVVIEESKGGFKNVSYTQCPVFIIPRAKLSTGTWTASISYKSVTSEGTSKEKTLEVK